MTMRTVHCSGLFLLSWWSTQTHRGLLLTISLSFLPSLSLPPIFQVQFKENQLSTSRPWELVAVYQELDSFVTGLKGVGQICEDVSASEVHDSVKKTMIQVLIGYHDDTEIGLSPHKPMKQYNQGLHFRHGKMYFVLYANFDFFGHCQYNYVSMTLRERRRGGGGVTVW